MAYAVGFLMNLGFFIGAIWNLATGHYHMALTCWVGMIASNANARLEGKADAT
jgi:hypothetical protein